MFWSILIFIINLSLLLMYCYLYCLSQVLIWYFLDILQQKGVISESLVDALFIIQLSLTGTCFICVLWLPCTDKYLFL